MRLFDLDFDSLCRSVLPPTLRGVRLLSLLRAFVAPLLGIYTAFRVYQADMTKELDKTGQVCRLQSLLNDAYDPALRRITIIDGPDLLPLFLHLEAELRPVFISNTAPQYIYTIPETIGGDDFIVNVPLALPANLAAVRALTDRYRLVSKKDFSIAQI